MNWQEFKKSFTQKQEDALWQYFIDHSRIQKNGFLGIMFYVKNIDDFWKRVHARSTGDFKRYEIADKMFSVKIRKDKFNMRSRIIQKGNWFDKLLLKFNSILSQYLVKRSVKVK